MNELQTHQGMDSRHMQKVNSSDQNSILIINMVIDDSLTCNVNKVYVYMILLMSIYAFLITMGLLLFNHLQNNLIYFTSIKIS